MSYDPQPDTKWALRDQSAHRKIFWNENIAATLDNIRQGDPCATKPGKPGVWFKSRKSHNREMHALMGNTAAAPSRVYDEAMYMAAVVEEVDRPEIRIETAGLAGPLHQPVGAGDRHEWSAD